MQSWNLKFRANCDTKAGTMTMNDAERRKNWDDAILKWKAGGEHPLRHHPHAVRCDGADGCYTVAPVRDLADPDCYKKRYCADHLPQRKRVEENMAVFSESDLRFLKTIGVDTTPTTFADKRMELARRIAKHEPPGLPPIPDNTRGATMTTEQLAAKVLQDVKQMAAAEKAEVRRQFDGIFADAD